MNFNFYKIIEDNISPILYKLLHWDNKEIEIYQSVLIKIFNTDKIYKWNFNKDSFSNKNNISSIREIVEYLEKANERSDRRKKEGVYYTDSDVTSFIICNTFINYLVPDNQVIYSKSDAIKKIILLDKKQILKLLCASIYDPTCGAGEFLIQSIRLKLEIAQKADLYSQDILEKVCCSCFGNDISTESTDISKYRLLLQFLEYTSINQIDKIATHLKQCFSNIDFVIYPHDYKKKYSIIIGNPPYVEYRELSKKSPLSYGNIYADVLHHSTLMLKEDGVMGYVIPLSYISTHRMSKIRTLINDNTKKQYILSYADRPDCLFIGAHQKLNIIICTKKSKQKGIFTSSYQYWYKSERKFLFDNVDVYNSTTSIDLIPKIGNSTEYYVYDKIQKISSKSILDCLDENSKSELYINMRACFWMKVFSFNPGSNEYKKLLVNKEYYPLLMCLLNSSLFFFYWITISDCWHITQKDLSGFRIPEKYDYKLFNSLWKELEKKLELTKKYIGSKQVEYEYKHNLCKDIIDIIDDNLKPLYNLSDEEVDYIKKYKLRYRMSNNINQINVVDLFAGAGGLSLGFKTAGFNIVLANEIDKEIAITYTKNHPETLMINDDIKNFTENLDSIIENELIKNYTINKKEFKRNLSSIDVVIGGPPCQGFSMAGGRIRKQNDFIDDPRNFLFKYYFKIIQKFEPKYFVFENVVGILSSKNGEIINTIKNIFEDKDNFKKGRYYLSIQVVNSYDYGVPQNRKRVIILGSKRKIDFEELKNNTLNQMNESLKEKFMKNTTVRDAISDLMTYDCYSDNGIPNHVGTKHNLVATQRISKIKPNENWQTLTNDNIKSVHSGAYGRLDWDKPATTITTRFDTPSAGRYIHPILDRTITPREAARIQSFPDDFVFYGNKSSICKQIGNAVPPQLAEFIAYMIKTSLNHD